ncbi:MAG: DUF4386 family protein [Maritimibacter sp.]|nr:DUF4386 family protein [Maritimibacter sp.]
MTLEKTGGFAALACAATYLFGFALLVTLLAPLGFGSNEIDAAAIVAYIDARPGILLTWNTVIYIVNALALAVLVVALHARLAPATPGWAAVARAFGLIWATLVLGAGMLANVTVERVGQLATTDAAAAADLWEVLHAVELGLGGGNEIAGGVWILTVSLAGLLGRSLGRIPAWIGIVTGASGLVTILPPLGDTAGAVFGLGAIVWFIAMGVVLVRRR